MPYALFEDDQKLSQEFPSELECWEHADEVGLVDLLDGKVVLGDGYTIQACVTGEPIAVPPFFQVGVLLVVHRLPPLFIYVPEGDNARCQGNGDHPVYPKARGYHGTGVLKVEKRHGEDRGEVCPW